MESVLKNFTCVTYGMCFMFFLITWLKLYKVRTKSRIFKFLFLEFSYMLFVYLRSLLFVSDFIRGNENYLRINNSIDTLLVPLSAVLMITILSPQKFSKTNVIFIHAPSILLVLIYLVTLNNIVLIILAVYTVLFAITFTILVYIMSSKYDNYIKNNFSSIDRLSVAWIRKGVLFLFVFLFIWLLSNMIDAWISIVIYNLFAIILWYLLYMHAIRHQSIEKMPNLLVFGNVQKKEDTYNQFYYVGKLNEYIIREKPYLNPTLSLTELASAIGTNRTYLSDYFNKSLNVSFYDYINTHRTQVACELLKETNNSLEVIAEQSGFNSLSTFRRAFSKQHKCTPKQFRNNHNMSYNA